jgi:hypothetical protein
MALASGWFEGAPVSKLLVGSILLSYVLQHHFYNPTLIDYTTTTLGGILQHNILCQLTFASAGDLVIGTTLLARMARQLERDMSSPQFLGFLLAVNGASIFVETMSVGFLPHVVAGPYPLLGALMLYYYKYTPRLYPKFMSFLGMTCSEKVFYYVWFLQVIYKHGAFFAGIGAFFGWLFFYFHPTVPFATQIYRLLDNVLSESPRMFVTTNPAAPNAAAAAQLRPPASVAAPVIADPAAIEQLVMMGFDPTQVEQVLRATNNNVQAAADQLLSNVS